MNPLANTFLVWLAVILLGLFGVILAVVLLGLLVVLVSAIVTSVCDDWRKSRE